MARCGFKLFKHKSEIFGKSATAFYLLIRARDTNRFSLDGCFACVLYTCIMNHVPRYKIIVIILATVHIYKMCSVCTEHLHHESCSQIRNNCYYLGDCATAQVIRRRCKWQSVTKPGAKMHQLDVHTKTKLNLSSI